MSAWLEEEQAVGAHFDSMEMCLALRSTLLTVRAGDTTLPAETRMLVRRALVTHLETVARLATSAAQYQVMLVKKLITAQMCSALLWKTMLTNTVVAVFAGIPAGVASVPCLSGRVKWL